MDGVVNPRFAVSMGRLGGLGVLNLDGLQTRYEDPTEAIREIADTPPEKINLLLQKLYTAPVQDGLIGQRIEQIKHGGVRCAVSTIPNHAERRGPLVQEAGADVLVVQGTVLTARHVSRSYKQLSFRELTQALDIPVVVGNCVDYATALELMDTGIRGLLVGVGPGAACTTRAVLGVGVPQVTATSDCSAARDDHLRRSGERVAIITDGGMRIGGDVAKAFASGADAVMIGSIFAATQEAAGHGNHWGMATPDPNLPRGTRIRTGVKGTLEEVLFGPAHVDDGSMNLVGALKSAMGVCGARTIREFQDTQMVIAPSIKTEGKTEQRAQRVGMGA
jgi:IMP dehydrogenase